MIKVKQVEVKAVENNVLEVQSHSINLHFQVVKLSQNKNNLKFQHKTSKILNITNLKINFIKRTKMIHMKHHILGNNNKNSTCPIIKKSILTE